MNTIPTRVISKTYARPADTVHLELLATALVKLITQDSPAEMNYKHIFQSWMLMNFNSLKLSSIFTSASDDGFPKEFCALMRQKLRHHMHDLIHMPTDSSIERLSKRYHIQHAIAAYAYFRPEEEVNHPLPRKRNDGKWEILNHTLTTFEQASTWIETPGLTYLFNVSPELVTDCGPLVVFRGTPPSSSDGRYISRLDNFSPFGVGYLQWLYIRGPLFKQLKSSLGRIDVVGHSQGGTLALRVATYAARQLSDRQFEIDADSPAGDEAFRDVAHPPHNVYVYIHNKDIVPLNSGAIPKTATVLLGSTPCVPARAHIHLGLKYTIIDGAQFNTLAGHHPIKQLIKKVAAIPLCILYTLALIAKSIRTLCEKPFKHWTIRPFNSLTLLEKLTLPAINLLLLIPRLIAKITTMLCHGIPFGIQWTTILISSSIPLKKLLT